MSEKREQSAGGASAEDRLEGMLRRWGAEEAVERTSAGEAPAGESLVVEPTEERRLRPHGSTWRAATRRWMPVAAGLVLLVAASLVFVAAGLRMANVPLGPAGLTEMEARLTEQLDLALGRVEETRSALERSQQERAGLAGELAEARRQAEASAAEAIAARSAGAAKEAELSRQAAGLRKEIEGYVVAAAAGEKKIAALSQARAAADEREAAARRELKATVASLGDRLGEMEARLESAEGRYATMLWYVRERYGAGSTGSPKSGSPGGAALAATRGPEETSRHLAASQRLARGVRLLPRCTALEREAGDSSLKELLGSLEVVLTQLEMTDSSDVRAGRSLAALLGRTGAVARVEAMSRRGDLSAEVRRWLMECQMVLAGVSDAA